MQSWKEFSNRLTNTLSLAHKASASDLPITYRNVRDSTAEVGRYLGLPSEPTEPKLSENEPRLAALQEALPRYFALAKAMAGDDLAAASAAAKELGRALGGLGIEGAALGASRDLAAMRKAFEPVSDALISTVKDIGVDRVGNVYVVHCPMAFDYEGADWLSREPAILNPYFGDEMLTCGTVTANLSFDPNEPIKGHEAEADDPHKHHR